MFSVVIIIRSVIGTITSPLLKVFEIVGFISVMSLFTIVFIILCLLLLLNQNFFGRAVIHIGAIIQLRDVVGNDWGSNDENRFVIIFSWFFC